MIPETGTREECKAALFEMCSYYPMEGELFVLDPKHIRACGAEYPEYWTVVGWKWKRPQIETPNRYYLRMLPLKPEMELEFRRLIFGGQHEPLRNVTLSEPEWVDMMNHRRLKFAGFLE